MKLTELERIHVGYLDTPLEYMPNLTKELGKGKLYVKRDDMTGLAFGGNKARKLDYLVKDALDHGYNALMTFGGVQTNHGRMTVAAAVRYNMKPILVLTGPKPDYCSGNLILDRMMGADVHFIDTTAYADLPEPEKSEKTAAFLAQETEKIVAEYEKQASILIMYRWAEAPGGCSRLYQRHPRDHEAVKGQASRPSTWSAAMARWVPSAVCWLAPSTSRLPLR